MKSEYMLLAIEAALQGMRNGDGGPFGCVIVKDDVVIAQGMNQVTSTHDPTAHAEIVAIRRACKALGSFQLDGCFIYTSCEPCPMCLGAIYWARPSAIYYAATRFDAAQAGFDDSFIYDEIALSIEDRTIPTAMCEREAALDLFVEWNAKKDKIAY